jgi:peptide-methionine (S)-S-oxide reductase
VENSVSTLSQSKAISPLETATLGGGCFWCLEAVYQDLMGVEKVVSGYAGGMVPNPSYEAVCSGSTGHAEVVQIQFDPQKLSYREILEVFFVIHDPTTLNRQGNDIGTQYRSVIYFHDAEQEAQAKRMLMELDQLQAFPDPIVTELASVPEFFPAEDYHQNYFANHPFQGYCMGVVAPKLAKFRKVFSAKRKTTD